MSLKLVLKFSNAASTNNNANQQQQTKTITAKRKADEAELDEDDEEDGEEDEEELVIKEQETTPQTSALNNKRKSEEPAKKKQKSKHDAAVSHTNNFINSANSIIAQVKNEDIEKIFWLPVTDQIAPGYSAAIAHPMDLSTISSKVESYASWQQILDDFNLMYDNATHFNPAGTYVHKEAKRLKKFTFALIKPFLNNAETTTTPARSTKRTPAASPPINNTPAAKNTKRRSTTPQQPSTPSSKSKQQEVTQLLATATSSLSAVERKKLFINVVKQLRSLDTNSIFAQPVAMDVPGYHEMIKEPMDFATLEKRIGNKIVSTVEALGQHLDLIFNNAKTFNSSDTIYYQEADRLHAASKPLVQQLTEQILNAYNESVEAQEESSGVEASQITSTPRKGSASAQEDNFATPAASSKRKKRTPKQKQQDNEEVEEESTTTPARGTPNSVSADTPTTKAVEFPQHNFSANELREIMRALLEQLKMADQYETFANPVSKEDAPEYHDVIKQPMDFATMTQKLNKEPSDYKTWAEFETDIELIFANCKQFNASQSVYWKEAARMQRVYKIKLKKIVTGMIAEGYTAKDIKAALEALAPAKKDTIASAQQQQQQQLQPEASTSNSTNENEQVVQNAVPALTSGSAASDSTAENKNLKKKPLKEVPLQNYLSNILEAVVREDKHRIFLLPVDTASLSDYLAHVTTPMDFTTIRKKISNDKYLTFDAFKRDLDLIFTNAMSYNKPSTIWYKEAQRLQQFGQQKAASVEEKLGGERVKELELQATTQAELLIREKERDKPLQQRTPKKDKELTAKMKKELKREQRELKKAQKKEMKKKEKLAAQAAAAAAAASSSSASSSSNQTAPAASSASASTSATVASAPSTTASTADGSSSLTIEELNKKLLKSGLQKRIKEKNKEGGARIGRPPKDPSTRVTTLTKANIMGPQGSGIFTPPAASAASNSSNTPSASIQPQVPQPQQQQHYQNTTANMYNSMMANNNNDMRQAPYVHFTLASLTYNGPANNEAAMQVVKSCKTRVKKMSEEEHTKICNTSLADLFQKCTTKSLSSALDFYKERKARSNGAHNSLTQMSPLSILQMIQRETEEEEARAKAKQQAQQSDEEVEKFVTNFLQEEQEIGTVAQNFDTTTNDPILNGSTIDPSSIADPLAVAANPLMMDSSTMQQSIVSDPMDFVVLQ